MHKFATLVLALLPLSAAAQTPAACSGLISLALPNTKILHADPIDPDVSLPPEIATAAKSLPPFCRVTAQLTPTPDSDIRMELWLPMNWNGLFRGQGNGGFAGSVDLAGIGRAVAFGYASGGTDTGHTDISLDPTWAAGHPEKVADYGYRSVHEMTVASQAILKAFYNAPAKHTFFASCSDGGREALMEAQRFPADYDGIVAGAPANNWTALLTNAVANARALSLTPASYIPAAKLSAIGAAVLNSCDAKDGLRDGIINDPRSCHINLNALTCQQGDRHSCLTKPQIKALKTLYTGLHAADGTLIFPGYLPGAETGPGGWTPWITGTAPGTSNMLGFGQGYFRNMVYNDHNWTIHSNTLDEAYAKANQVTAASLNSTDPNLTPFFARGGKLILFHGWNDPAISALNTIDYDTKMLAATPQGAASSRLYMVPGMQHCSGGPGVTSFGQSGWLLMQGPDDPQHDIILAVEQWVDQGTAPTRIIATKYEGAPTPVNVIMTRPLCPYPQIATYNGTGDLNTASSFACIAPKVNLRK